MTSCAGVSDKRAEALEIRRPVSSLAISRHLEIIMLYGDKVSPVGYGTINAVQSHLISRELVRSHTININRVSDWINDSPKAEGSQNWPVLGKFGVHPAVDTVARMSHGTDPESGKEKPRKRGPGRRIAAQNAARF
jgi:hypothetical protein